MAVMQQLQKWHYVITLRHHNKLCLSTTKTTIIPRDATALGWVWLIRTLQASPQNLTNLQSIPDVPVTVHGLLYFMN